MSVQRGTISFVFEGFTNEQIAKVLNKSKKQVENLLYRAKQSLKSILEREGITL